MTGPPGSHRGSRPDPELDPEIEPELEAALAARRPHLHPLAPHLLFAVMAGGVAGASARDGLTRAIGAGAGGFPWATFVINVTGAFLLGLLVGLIGHRPRVSGWARPLFGTGLLGGFTTYSTFVVESDRLMALGHPLLCVGYVASTLLLGALASYVGLVAGRPDA